MIKMGAEDWQQRLSQLAKPLLTSLSLDILLIEDVIEQGRRILRFYLEPAGVAREVNLADCEKFSRLFSPLLEAESGLGENYSLEVSSPGLNRPLVKIDHFEQQIAKIIKLSLKEAIANRKKITGRLKEVVVEGIQNKKSFIIIESEGQSYKIPLDLIKKANLDYFAS